MAKYTHTILGIKPVNFKDKEGREVHGYSVFAGTTSDNVVGTEVEKIWFKPDFMNAIISKGVPLSDLVGRKMLPVYNRFGKLDSAYIEGVQ